MKKSVKLMAAAVATVLALGAFGLAGCNKKTDYPYYRNPEHVEETSEKYVINVRSEGGLKLSGVRVTSYRGDAAFKTSISQDGVIELAATLGEYTLKVDESSLPAGYYVPEGASFVTNPNEREEVNIVLKSKLVETAATSYKLGQVMSDFTFTDASGVKHKLSDSLAQKKAVVLNFFYTGCQPCRREFPAVQKAYEAFSDDVEIFAICSTHQGDTNLSVSEFKASYGLSFPMGVDDLNLISAFGVGSFPTTVVIDRYGLIAYLTKGGEPSESFWKGLFNEFTSSTYTQKLSTEEGSEENPDVDRVIPNVTMPESAVMQAAANGAGVNATYEADADPYAWPFLSTGEYIYSSNKGVQSSYSIVHVMVEMNANDVLSFEYNVSSEENSDLLYAFVDGQIMNASGWSATGGWKSANVYVADKHRTVDLSFVYQKDAQDVDEASSGEDTAKIRNIHLLKSDAITSPMDVMRPAVSDYDKETKSFGSYIDAEYNAQDGYYHKKDGSGSILYMSLIQPTAWTDAHMPSSVTTLSDGSSYYNSIYYMSYFRYSEGEGADFRFVFNDDDSLTDAIIEADRIQMFMDETDPYYLIPVTKEMHDWMVEFTKQYAKDTGRTAGEKEWLELCYYFDHYGPADAKSLVSCDHTRGLRRGNAYTAYLSNDPALASSETKGVTAGSNKALVEFPLQTYRGTYYKFTATQKGIYKVRSYTHKYAVLGQDENGNDILEKDDGNFESSQYAYPAMFLMSEDGRELAYVESIMDYDQFRSPDMYSESDFNTYLLLDAGETVYLKMCLDLGDTGYFDFTIDYLGTTHSVDMLAVTDQGLWESEGRVSTIENIYVAADDCYYSLKGGEPDSKIYINFTNANFMRYGELGFKPLKAYVDAGVFNKYNPPEDSDKDSAQEIMEEYLAAALANGGDVEANKEIVYILQQLIDDVCEDGGEGNGWLMFAYYNYTFGE